MDTHNPISNQISHNKNYLIAIIKCHSTNNNNINNNYIHNHHNQYNLSYREISRDNIIFKTKIIINIRNHNVSKILDKLTLNKINITINRIQYLIMI